VARWIQEHPPTPIGLRVYRLGSEGNSLRFGFVKLTTCGEPGERLLPAFQVGVDEDTLGVVARGAWQNSTGPKPSTSTVTGCGSRSSVPT